MVRWRTNGGYPFVQLRNEVDRLMGDIFGGASQTTPSGSARAFPAVNVWEDGERLFAEAELPGVQSDDVDISVVGNELTIRGRRPAAATDGASFHRRERGAGEFSRTLRLPYDVDAGGVEATLRDGVLLLKLPKAASARPARFRSKLRVPTRKRRRTRALDAGQCAWQRSTERHGKSSQTEITNGA